MKKLTLTIADHKLQTFLAFIRDLDYVEVLTSDTSSEQPSVETPSDAQPDDFLALAGMWEDRDISAEELRAKSWPSRQ